MVALQLPLDLQFRPAYGRNDFLITKSNEEAVAMIDAWPQTWGPFPALTLYGSSGSGKSHLAAVWAQKTGAHIILPEEFENVEATALLQQERHVVLERLDLLTGEVGREQKIFHIYNMFKAAGKFILLTSHTSPAHLTFYCETWNLGCARRQR